ISVSIIPLMIRAAPRLGLVDRPDPRKVHHVPMPRVGGLGIAIGALPLILWTPIDSAIVAYLFGALVLVIFGLIDDAGELGPTVKFLGQFIAVLPTVFFADIYIAHIPFLGIESIPDWFGRLFTVFALVGVANAVAVSDGLDGLTGGLSLLSLATIA